MDGNNEKREPATFEDLWLMRETSSGWFDGEIKCENVLGDDTPEVGATESITWHVQPSFDHVDIAMCTHIIDEVGQLEKLKEDTATAKAGKCINHVQRPSVKEELFMHHNLGGRSK